MSSPLNIGRYRVLDALGEGAMGQVYRAFDPHLSRIVAIKTVRNSGLPLELVQQYEQRFLNEARSSARLRHPGIVAVYDAGQANGLTYLVMEFVRGVNLRDCLRAGVSFSPRGAIALVVRVLDALSHAHEHKILHRDIKPENILLDTTGQIRLADFGIAKMLDADMGNLTLMSGQLIGTPRYMAPEQIRGAEPDERCDLFACGLLLYELLAGKPAFGGTNFAEISHHVLHGEPEPLSTLLDDAPAGVDAVLGRVLAKDPARRPASAQALRAELLTLAAACPVQVPASAGARAFVRPACTERLQALLAAAPASSDRLPADVAALTAYGNAGRVPDVSLDELPEVPSGAVPPLSVAAEGADVQDTVPMRRQARRTAAGWWRHGWVAVVLLVMVTMGAVPVMLSRPGVQGNERVEAPSQAVLAVTQPAVPQGPVALEQSLGDGEQWITPGRPGAVESTGTAGFPSGQGVGALCTGMSLIQRERCLWQQCAMERNRQHPACARFR